MYLDENNGLVIPALNIYSLLCAENTKSVCRQFFGKQGKTIALGIASYTQIQEMELPLMDDRGQIMFSGDWDAKIKLHDAVARLKGGVPNPKKRPLVKTPWYLEFTMTYVDNRYCTLHNLRQAFDMGGMLGLGTFRPFFGSYQLTKWETIS